MSRFIKHMVAACTAAIFLVASLYCCCFSSIQWTKQRHSCCQTKDGESQKSSKQDCPHCNATFNAEQTVKDVHDIQFISLAVVFKVEYKGMHAPIFIGKSLFINGPPGPFYVVPLYIKNPSLRI